MYDLNLIDRTILRKTMEIAAQRDEDESKFLEQTVSEACLALGREPLDHDSFEALARFCGRTTDGRIRSGILREIAATQDWAAFALTVERMLQADQEAEDEAEANS